MKTNGINSFNQVIAYAIVALFFSSCIVSPVGSHFESANTIEKGKIQLAGSYTKTDMTFDGEIDKLNYNIGVTAGYGVSDRFDIKFRYIKLTQFKEEGSDQSFGYNFFSLSPKFKIVDKYFSAKLPFSLYQWSEQGDPGSGTSTEAGNTFTITPTLIGTLPVVENQVDVTIIADYEFFLEEDAEDYLGFSLGFGFSKDLNAWAIRPEVGYQFSPEDADFGFLTYGIGINYDFGIKK
jgi:hypothetical protein